jgi:transposase
MKSANNRAEERSKAGYTRELKQDRSDHINRDPPKKGSQGYSVWFRSRVLAYKEATSLKEAAAAYQVSEASVCRWGQRLIPYRKTGNKQRCALTRDDQILLAMGIYIYPSATADELACFIFSNGGEVYERNAIYKRLQELGISRKRASYEAQGAYTTRNLVKASLFWGQPPRLGIVGIPRYRFLDIDEAGFCLKSLKTNYGWAPKPVRVREIHHYSRHTEKLNLILAIEPGNPRIAPHERGSIQNPRKWWQITDRSVDQFVFADFINDICNDIERNPTESDDERVFLWDNLSAHLTPVVTNTLEHRPSRHNFYSIARPAYQPKWAPIEYVFCQISNDLTSKVLAGWDTDTLREELHNLLLHLGDDYVFNRTFAHCGYDL